MYDASFKRQLALWATVMVCIGVFGLVWGSREGGGRGAFIIALAVVILIGLVVIAIALRRMWR